MKVLLSVGLCPPSLGGAQFVFGHLAGLDTLGQPKSRSYTSPRKAKNDEMSPIW